jgi:phosphatidylethanolamine/phosphatidyl-N-methylethanolamine N-methyltransferase
VISVVPEPERVMEEMARVCKPGGEVLIVGHFARDKGLLASLERLFAPLADVIGWHSDFALGRVLGVPSLSVAASRPVPPFGIFTFLVQRKREAAQAAA